MYFHPIHIDALNPGGVQRVNDEKFDGLDFYQVMWTAYEPLRRLRKYLAVMGEFRGVMLAVRSYQLFRNEEQSDVEEGQELAGVPVSCRFDE